MTLRLAWFATARGTGSRGLFESARNAIAAGRLDAELAVVFCNRERGQSANTDAFLDAVTAAGVPLVAISSGAWRKRLGGDVSLPAEAIAPWRHDFDRAVWEAIAPFSPNVGVLAGYMLIATRELCERLPLLNLHPAEPGGPVGTWQEVILALMEVGASTSGMMTQRATKSLDRGPVVTSCRYPIRGGAWDALWDERRGPASEGRAAVPGDPRRGSEARAALSSRLAASARGGDASSCLRPMRKGRALTSPLRWKRRWWQSLADASGLASAPYTGGRDEDGMPALRPDG